MLGTTHTVRVHGIHIGRDFLTALRDVFGGRSRSLERAYAQTAHEVLEVLGSTALTREAHAVLGVRLEPIQGRHGAVGVLATGTMVQLRDTRND